MIRDDAIEIWNAGVNAVHGRKLVVDYVRVEGNTLFFDDEEFDLDDFNKILVVGGGKFSHFMAEGLEAALGTKVSHEKNLSGLITVPDGSNRMVSLNYVHSEECRPAGINLPTQRVICATRQMVDMLERCDKRTLVIALISGGGSALIEHSELPIEDIISATSWLSNHGADIIQLNTVRIAISNVKGGGLARAMPAGTMTGLIVSDVPGDDMRFVSSGPTVEFFDGDVIKMALAALNSFGAADDPTFPKSVIEYLKNKSTPQPAVVDTYNFLIGDATVALNAATEKAKALGYRLATNTLDQTADCDQLANAAAAFCRAKPASKECVVSLGEPIVSPGKGAGQGGRNQHAVLLAAARLLDFQPDGHFCFLSAGTDGEDGNTSVAGASISDGDLDPIRGEIDAIVDTIQRFDSHSFLSKHELVFESGATGTNVADLRILLRAPR